MKKRPGLAHFLEQTQVESHLLQVQLKKERGCDREKCLFCLNELFIIFNLIWVHYIPNRF